MWLVKFTDNWADEFDVEGFMVLSNKDFMQWAQLIEEVSKKIDSGHSLVWYFGANDYLLYEEGRQLKESFSCDVIADSQANVLNNLLINGYGSYGFFPSSEFFEGFLVEVENNEEV